MTDADRPEAQRESASDDATHTADESARSHPVAPALAPGSLIDRFVLLKRIGEGGMGSVWAAYDGELDRKIAIKLVLPERASDGHVRARMLREAQALARLSHPNVVTVHEVGVHDEQIYVAMEHVEGETLKAWLKREPVGAARIDRLLEIMRQAGRGLAAAHAADMVHRDFKPANVIVGADGRVRVVDFGLARVHAGVTSVARDELVATFREDALRSSSGDGFERGSVSPVARGIEAAVTEAGTFVGTPRYMAPEQFGGKPIDPRADQFSFCTVLFEGLFGRSPWTGTTVAKIHAEMLDGPPKLPSEVEIAPWLRTALRKGLSPRIGHRYASIETLLEAITPPAATVERARGRARWLGAAVLSCIAMAVASWAWLRPPEVAPNPCEGVGRRIDEVWNDPARAEIAAAFRATGVPYADTALASVSAKLEDYRVEWSDAATKACLLEARDEWDGGTETRGQTACLDLRHGELAHLVSLLTSADVDGVERAVDATHALTPVSWCRAAGAGSMPEEKKLLNSRLRLAEAKTLDRMGRDKEAMAIARDIAAQAAIDGSEALRADALLILGLIDRRREVGIRVLEDAFWSAMTADEDDIAVRAAIAVIRRTSDEDTCNAWRRRAGALLRRRRDDRRSQLDLMIALGRAADVRGNPELGADYLQRAIDELSRSPDQRDDIFLMRAWWMLADSQAHANPGNTGNLAYAMALDIAKRRFGENHPIVESILLDLAAAEAMAHNFRGATLHLEQAARIGGESVTQLRIASQIAASDGRISEAMSYGLRAHELLADGDSDARFRVNSSIGSALAIAGRPREAIPLLLDSLHMEERLNGEAHTDTSQQLNSLAYAFESMGNFRESARYSRRAADVLIRGGEHARAALPFSNLAVNAYVTGEFGRAISTARHAIDILQYKTRADSELCFPLRLMGLSLIALERPVEAIPVLERALELHATSTFDSREIPKTQLALARALWDGRSDRERANALAESARTTLLRDDPYSVELRETDEWLRTHRMRPTGN